MFVLFLQLEAHLSDPIRVDSAFWKNRVTRLETPPPPPRVCSLPGVGDTERMKRTHRRGNGRGRGRRQVAQTRTDSHRLTQTRTDPHRLTQTRTNIQRQQRPSVLAKTCARERGVKIGARRVVSNIIADSNLETSTHTHEQA